MCTSLYLPATQSLLFLPFVSLHYPMIAKESTSEELTGELFPKKWSRWPGLHALCTQLRTLKCSWQKFLPSMATSIEYLALCGWEEPRHKSLILRPLKIPSQSSLAGPGPLRGLEGSMGTGVAVVCVSPVSPLRRPHFAYVANTAGESLWKAQREFLLEDLGFLFFFNTPCPPFFSICWALQRWKKN